MLQEALINCPFCKALTVKVLHQPFVVRAKLTKSRLGSGTPIYTKEKTEVLSGCDGCGKSAKEIEKHLSSDREVTREEHRKRVERLQSSGLPTKIVSTRNR